MKFIILMIVTIALAIAVIVMTNIVFSIKSDKEIGSNAFTPDGFIKLGDAISIGHYKGIVVRRINLTNWVVLIESQNGLCEVTVDWKVMNKVSSKETK